LLGAVIISGFFLFQYSVSRGKWIGFGDVKLGLFLGSAAGWPLILLVLFVAYYSGAIFGLVLMAMGKKQLSSKLPFGTFLSLSAIIVMIFSNVIMGWYSKLLGL
jgi:prepilin signal peptidase PulO-like enzyme (type II secretory pathway)